MNSAQEQGALLLQEMLARLHKLAAELASRPPATRGELWLQGILPALRRAGCPSLCDALDFQCWLCASHGQYQLSNWKAILARSSACSVGRLAWIMIDPVLG